MNIHGLTKSFISTILYQITLDLCYMNTLQFLSKLRSTMYLHSLALILHDFPAVLVHRWWLFHKIFY